MRLIVCFCVLALSSNITAIAHAEEPAADVKQLTAQVEKLLVAYNKDDTKAFYADWAKVVAAITTPQTYDFLYKNMAKKELGDYQPNTLAFRKEGSVLSGDLLIVYFEGKFAKDVPGLVAVNFQKEDGMYKFVQVQMSKKP